MISITKQGGKIRAYITELFADRVNDISYLPTNVAPGSKCYIAENSSWYILNHQGAWISMKNTGGAEEGEGMNYNELENAPVVNLTGTEEKPIILQKLDYGSYAVTGPYKVVPEDEGFLLNPSVFSMTVLDDNITSNKVVKIEDYEDGELYIETIIFTNDGYIKDKVYPTRVRGLDLITF